MFTQQSVHHLPSSESYTTLPFAQTGSPLMLLKLVPTVSSEEADAAKIKLFC
jgi:hypothetical protein